MQVITLNATHTHTQGLYFTVAPVFVSLICCTEISEATVSILSCFSSFYNFLFVRLLINSPLIFPSVLTLVLRDSVPSYRGTPPARTQPANAISLPGDRPFTSVHQLSFLSFSYLSSVSFSVSPDSPLAILFITVVYLHYSAAKGDLLHGYKTLR